MSKQWVLYYVDTGAKRYFETRLLAEAAYLNVFGKKRVRIERAAA